MLFSSKQEYITLNNQNDKYKLNKSYFKLNNFMRFGWMSICNKIMILL